MADVVGEKILSDVSVFGLALYKVSSAQNHAAIVFSEDGGTGLKVLHLAYHLDLRCDEHSSKYCLVSMPGIPEEELDYVAERASRIYEKNKDSQIPYGLSYSGADVFTLDDQFMHAPGAGLTCATFVLAFLKRTGYKILDIDSWKSRADDSAWQSRILSGLVMHLDAASAQAQLALIGKAYRFRPEEVVASSHFFRRDPIPFEDAERFGAMLMQEITGAAG